MTEVLFYHMTRSGLERVLPQLLERSLQRGWRAKVQTGSQERAEALNAFLWTYQEDSFLPHGGSADGFADQQPIFLSATDETPNGAQVLFLVDGADPGPLEMFERCVLIFDGRDESAVAVARDHWKALKTAGHQLTYWQQSESGRWEQKA